MAIIHTSCYDLFDPIQRLLNLFYFSRNIYHSSKPVTIISKKKNVFKHYTCKVVNILFKLAASQLFSHPCLTVIFGPALNLECCVVIVANK